MTDREGDQYEHDPAQAAGAEIRAEREAALYIRRVRIEYHTESEVLGLGAERPRLSWMVETERPAWRQAGYEIEAYDAAGQLWASSGLLRSAESVLVPWPFAPLHSRQRLQVRVRVEGQDGSRSPWSAPVTLEAGLLQPSDWEARFITPDWDEDTTRPQPAPFLRREFEVAPGLAAARLYITALGVYEAHLNGQVVGDQVLAPGWTSYDQRLLYQTFDVTALLHEGRNAIGAIVGDGWFRGRLGFHGGGRNLYGERLGLLAQLELYYADGRCERVVTDLSWRASTGPIRASDLYDGEEYDARLEQDGWSEPGYDDRAWQDVRLLEWDLTRLAAPEGPPVRRIALLAPQAILTSPSGRTILDFGQNVVGRLRLRVRGEAGQQITLRHAEILQEGELCTRPLRTARATDRYILRGGGLEIWEPRFTFHGFRYAEVKGWPGSLQADDIQAVICHSDLERTGWFSCSEPLLNRFHDNVVWSMRGNFLSIPTDCPQRDERLGWTGDIQIFAPTACFLYDCAGFLSSWLRDLASEQTPEGIVPFVVPDILRRIPALPEGRLLPVAAWGDAAVLVPWTLYQRYGDSELLRRQFPSMRAWVDLIDRLAGAEHLWRGSFQFGDWLDPAAPPEKPAAARAAPEVLATAYFARSAEIVSLTAGVLGLRAEEARYRELAAQVRAAFRQAYVSPDGRIFSDAPTVYALALQFNLLENEELRQAAGRRLVELVQAEDYHLCTGFVGTPLLCDALCSVGAAEAAFRLLLQRECPSWLYPVTMGATTVWERWDSLLPDGSVNPGEMTSFNHYALGSVADWLHRTVAGLAPAAPGYRRLLVRPLPGGGLTRAEARLRTPYGQAEVRWQLVDGLFELTVVVPPNTTASIILPGRQQPAAEVGSGTHRWRLPYPAGAEADSVSS
ncbi:glycoside hydrolase family 78 protein [Thermogemmatispora tikiterensis]|uniref:glycoside hydrolase family 78 protein n=1 Tax=Thermogemmatispora tikiterensis TaxID=1825093 RepID=UPI000DD80153|nr:glycoside hydrolase family 78 protein [Thermogemmatispora tikiterensis]